MESLDDLIWNHTEELSVFEDEKGHQILINGSDNDSLNGSLKEYTCFCGEKYFADMPLESCSYCFDGGRDFVQYVEGNIQDFI